MQFEEKVWDRNMCQVNPKSRANLVARKNWANLNRILKSCDYFYRHCIGIPIFRKNYFGDWFELNFNKFRRSDLHTALDFIFISISILEVVTIGDILQFYLICSTFTTLKVEKSMKLKKRNYYCRIIRVAYLILVQ